MKSTTPPIESIPSDPVDAAYLISSAFLNWEGPIQVEELTEGDTYDSVMQWLSLGLAINDHHNLGLQEPVLQSNRAANVELARVFFTKMRNWSSTEVDKRKGPMAVQSHRSAFAAQLGHGFRYAFSDPEFKKIQSTINRLRTAVMNLQGINPSHKRRILSRLEALQQELHPKMDNLDRIAGFVLDTTVILRLAHGNVKPIIDDIKELWSITVDAIKASTGLPAGEAVDPLLPSGHDSDSQHE